MNPHFKIQGFSHNKALSMPWRKGSNPLGSLVGRLSPKLPVFFDTAKLSKHTRADRTRATISTHPDPSPHTWHKYPLLPKNQHRLRLDQVCTRTRQGNQVSFFKTCCAQPYLNTIVHSAIGYMLTLVRGDGDCGSGGGLLVRRFPHGVAEPSIPTGVHFVQTTLSFSSLPFARLRDHMAPARQPRAIDLVVVWAKGIFVRYPIQSV